MCKQKPSHLFLLFFDFLFYFDRMERAVLFALLQNKQNCELHFTIYVAILCHFEVPVEFQQLWHFPPGRAWGHRPATLPSSMYL